MDAPFLSTWREVMLPAVLARHHGQEHGGIGVQVRQFRFGAPRTFKGKKAAGRVKLLTFAFMLGATKGWRWR